MVEGGILSFVSSFIGSNTMGVTPKVLLFFTLGLVIYSVFIFYFYRFLAKKNVINLDLSQYNKYEFGGVYRFFAVLFFVIEYIIILPFVTFFWFGILSILILLLARELTIAQILTVSVSLIGAIRITSFISEDLSRDLAKMIPFAFLGLALTTSQFFNIPSVMEQLSQIPLLLRSSLSFLVFIILVEIVMRIFEFVGSIFRKKETEETAEETK